MSGYRFCVNVVTAGFLTAAGSAGWLGFGATAAADPGGGSSSSHESGGSHSSAGGSHSSGSSQRSSGSGASGSAGSRSGHDSKTSGPAGASPAQHGGGASGSNSGTKSSGSADAPGHAAATKPNAPSGSHSADSPSAAAKQAGSGGGVPTKEKRALTDPKPGTSARVSGVAGEHGVSSVAPAQPPGHATKVGEHGSADSKTLHPKHIEGHKEGKAADVGAAGEHHGDAARGEHAGPKGDQHVSPNKGGAPESHSNGISLNAEQNAAANKFLEQARRAEPDITKSLRGIVDNVPGSQFIGLGDRLKTEESFKRKLYTFVVTNPNLSTAEHLAEMRDSVRYTVQLPHELYTATTQQTIDRLVAEGYEPVRLTNTWGQPGYQGFNSAWREPTTGHTFEVQFHTPASFDAKTQTHVLYEEERLPSTSPQRVKELQDEKGRVFDSVPRPSGSSSISLSPNGKRK